MREPSLPSQDFAAGGKEETGAMKKTRAEAGRVSWALFLLAVLAALLTAPAVAGAFPHHGDIRRFHDRDYHEWRRGRWVHDWHDHHFGWWWVVTGRWFFYPAPVYPYPDPYVPPRVVVQQAPPAVPAPAPPPTKPWYESAEEFLKQGDTGAPPKTPGPTAPQTWYHCDKPAGYYPYVSECPGGWKAVPATPPPPPAEGK